MSHSSHPGTTSAQGGQTAAESVVERMKTLMASETFAKARASLDAGWERLLQDIITLTEIPAPPFHEAERARAYAGMLKAVGLSDVEIDAEGNATGLRNGRNAGGPILALGAHLDTVFPPGTDVTVRREENRLSAPGIGDNGCGLGLLLALARALDHAGVQTERDILFVGNVGEEGDGDLRGVRHLFAKGKYKDRIERFISFETGRGYVMTRGVGSKRYRVNFHGPGGHSYLAFGLVNPAQAMANAIVAFGQMQVPKLPKTTFNVGVVAGGTSVNSIPHDVAMMVDMRSEGKEALQVEVDYLMSVLSKAVDAENAARSTERGKISCEITLIGDRPVGSTPVEKEIVQVATAAMNAMGIAPTYQSRSTDANVPMSLGIEAITLGSGFAPERFHSLDETLPLEKGPTLEAMFANLATVIALARGD